MKKGLGMPVSNMEARSGTPCHFAALQKDMKKGLGMPVSNMEARSGPMKDYAWLFKLNKNGDLAF